MDKYAYIRYVNFIGTMNRQTDKSVNRRLVRRKIVVRKKIWWAGTWPSSEKSQTNRDTRKG